MRVSRVLIHPEQDHQLESRMREIRQSGSEGGGGREASPYPNTICRRSAATYSSLLKSVQAPRGARTVLSDWTLLPGSCTKSAIPRHNRVSLAAHERRHFVRRLGWEREERSLHGGDRRLFG